jgi:hypothetical protein
MTMASQHGSHDHGGMAARHQFMKKNKLDKATHGPRSYDVITAYYQRPRRPSQSNNRRIKGSL